MSDMTLYLGFIRDQGILIPTFVTDTKEYARTLALKNVDDALPNNAVEVHQILFNAEALEPVIVASWTPEGEHIQGEPFDDG